MGEPMARLGAFGPLGLVIILSVISSVRLPELLSPSNFVRMLRLIIGGISVLFSAFRTSAIQTLLALVLTGIRDLKWAALILLPLIGISLFAVSVVQSEFVHFPRAVQRSLQFIPGKWDVDVAADAQASNEFRQRVWTVFTREYFPQQPWFGRGFGFRKEIARQSVYTSNPNWDRDMVEVGNIHNGFFATLDAIGIVGTVCFAGWNLRLLGQTFRVSKQTEDPAAAALRFLALYLGVLIVFYWIGAYTLGSFLPQEFALAGVFLRLHRTLKSQAASQQRVATVSPDLRPQLSSV
jgi:O-antigen ligase